MFDPVDKAPVIPIPMLVFSKNECIPSLEILFEGSFVWTIPISSRKAYDVAALGSSLGLSLSTFGLISLGSCGK